MQALNIPPSFSHPNSYSHPNMALLSGGAPLPRFIGAVEDHWQLYSDRSSDYVLGSTIGFGASSIVYAATYYPPNGPSMPCALKVLDLDKLPLHSWALLKRETTLMSLSKHPNVLRVRGSWMDGHKLYIALRLMNKGSAADVMRYGWPGGLEEEVIKCILEQTLQGLNYLHINGFIHRDVKAANLLIDDDGTVLLGDLGVAADLSEGPTHTLSFLPSSNDVIPTVEHEDSRSAPLMQSNHVVIGAVPTAKPRIGKRKSFVGTPCWMAPELIQGKQYDSSADIWSFGITALELSQGRPPRSREPPQKVLLRTIQDDPPTLDRIGGVHKYSKAFQEMVESCLVKDPSKRPTAAQLLQTPFFRGTRKKSHLINSILKDLPPLTKRQERRVVPGNQIYRTVDSWDFTVHSVPNSSTVRKSIERSIVEGERHSTYSRSSKRRSGSGQSVSASLPVEELDHLAFELEETLEQKEEDKAIMEATTVSPLQDSEKIANSYAELMDDDGENEIFLRSKSIPIPTSKPTESSFNPSPKADIALSASPSSIMTSSTTASMAGISSSASSSHKGLWNKIRSKTSSNVKKVTSISALTGSSSKR